MSRNGKKDSYELDTSSLPALPKGWCWTTLGQLRSESLNGYGKRKGEDGKPIIVLRLADIQDGRISLESPRRINSTTEDIRRYCLKSDDLLIIRVNGSPDLVGRFVRVDGNPEATLFCDHFIRIRLFEPRTSSYVRLFADTGSARKYIDSHKVCSAGQNTISQSSLDGMPVPLPPFNEQCRIKAKIEELFSDLDAGVAALERVKANLKRYRAAVLKAAVEGRLTEEWRKKNRPKETGQQLLDRILKERRRKWEEEQLAAYAKAGKTPPAKWKDKYKEPAGVDDTNLPALPEGWCWATPEQLASTDAHSLAIGPFGSDLKVSDYQDTGVPLVFVRNIRAGTFGGDSTRYVSQEKAAELRAHAVEPGDVLITKMGDPPGDARIYPNDQPPAIITADCIKFRPSRILPEPRFFGTAVNSQVVREQIVRITKGVAQLKVSLARFAGIALPLPPIVEQQQIVAEVDRRLSIVEEAESQIVVNLKRSTRLRQAILKQAFEGKLVPQDPTDEPATALLHRIAAERHSDTGNRKPKRPVAQTKSPGPRGHATVGE